MPGFVANTPAVTEATITNVDFYPDIEPSACRAALRLKLDDITPDRLRHALVNAIRRVNTDLITWKAAQILAGYNYLDDVPCDDIDDTSEKTQLYYRAVYSFAKAELIERYRDYDTTLNASQRAEELDLQVDDYRRDAIVAVRGIMDKPSSTVELI